jgi:hypothetical protein
VSLSVLFVCAFFRARENACTLELYWSMAGSRLSFSKFEIVYFLKNAFTMGLSSRSRIGRKGMSLCEKGCKNTSEVRGNAHAATLFFLSLMNTTWLNTAGGCYAHTLSDAHLSATIMWRRVLCMNNTTSSHGRHSSATWAVEGLGPRYR